MLFQFLRRLLKAKDRPSIPDLSAWQQYKWQSYACADHHPVQILKVPTSSVAKAEGKTVHEETPQWDAELPEIHPLRALKDTLDRWHLPKKKSKNELSE